MTQHTQARSPLATSVEDFLLPFHSPHSQQLTREREDVVRSASSLDRPDAEPAVRRSLRIPEVRWPETSILG